MQKETKLLFLGSLESEIIYLLTKGHKKNDVANKLHINEEVLEKRIEGIIRKINLVQSCDCYRLYILR